MTSKVPTFVYFYLGGYFRSGRSAEKSSVPHVPGHQYYVPVRSGWSSELDNEQCVSYILLALVNARKLQVWKFLTKYSSPGRGALQIGVVIFTLKKIPMFFSHCVVESPRAGRDLTNDWASHSLRTFLFSFSTNRSSSALNISGWWPYVDHIFIN